MPSGAPGDPCAARTQRPCEGAQRMSLPFSRRDLLKGLAAGTALAALPAAASAGPLQAPASQPGWVTGHLTGAEAVVETLLQEGVGCVFGIPGAQENELW